MLNLSLVSNITQRILTQSNNAAYGTRGLVRVQSVPPDRKLDYWFRDFYMVVATAYLGEMGFRGVDVLYNIPLMTQALRLNQLSALRYTADNALMYPGALNYKRMPDVLRARMMGSLVKSDSISHVPEVLSKIAQKNGQDLTPPEREQVGLLLQHLQKNLNFRAYGQEHLVKPGHLTAEHLESVIKHAAPVADLEAASEHELPNLIKRVFSTPQEVPTTLQRVTHALGQVKVPFRAGMNGFRKLVRLNPKAYEAKPLLNRAQFLEAELEKLQGHFAYASPEEREMYNRLASALRHAVKNPDAIPLVSGPMQLQMNVLCKKVAENRKAHLDGIWDALSKEFGDSITERKTKLLNAAEDAMTSRTTLSALKRIQKSGTWPKMVSSVLLNLVFYGWLANQFDVKVLQPWQKKIVAERGSSEELVKPGYQGLIPAGGVLVAGMWNKMPLLGKLTRRMGYFSRWAVVAGAALATYTGTTWVLMKRVVSKPPADGKGPVAQKPGPQAGPQNGPQPGSASSQPSAAGPSSAAETASLSSLLGQNGLGQATPGPQPGASASSFPSAPSFNDAAAASSIASSGAAPQGMSAQAFQSGGQYFPSYPAATQPSLAPTFAAPGFSRSFQAARTNAFQAAALR